VGDTRKYYYVIRTAGSVRGGHAWKRNRLRCRQTDPRAQLNRERGRRTGLARQARPNWGKSVSLAP
ncbi:MAG: hypothetical protein RL385_3779, partial [Pseudomonadota bacterium]